MSQHTRDVRVSRRRLLAAGGAVTVAAMAGCSAIGEFFQDVVLEDVNLYNEASKRVRGSVTVVDGAGDTVLDETFDLVSTDAAESQDEEKNSAATYDEVWTDAGSYEITVELEDTEIEGTARASKTVTIADTEADMAGVVFGSDETDEPIRIGAGNDPSGFFDDEDRTEATGQ